MDILQRIIELRNDRNWSECQLAEQAGLTQSTVSSWFRKNLIPSVTSLEKVCDAFDMTMSQFFAEEGDSVLELKPDQIRFLKCVSRLQPEQLDVLIKFISTL